MTAPDRPSRVILVTPDLADNSLGRTYCLWLLARGAGMDVRVVSSRGAEIWYPLRDSEFARDCGRLPPARSAAAARLADLVGPADLVLAVKPLPESLGICIAARRTRDFPLCVDIDDPDLEVRYFDEPLHRRMRHLLRRPWFVWQMSSMRRAARSLPRSVSNPVLQGLYGGVVVPHVRGTHLPVEHSVQEEGLSIAFVGTPRPHKGLTDLREAVSGLASRGTTLTVTADAPDDAHPWENWLGRTSLAEGAAVLAAADIVVIPTRSEAWGLGQLPVKLIDAMCMGAAVITTDVGPARWAVGDSALLVPPGDADALRTAILSLTGVEARRSLGRAAHSRATSLFSVSAVEHRFRAHLQDVWTSPRRTRQVRG